MVRIAGQPGRTGTQNNGHPPGRLAHQPPLLPHFPPLQPLPSWSLIILGSPYLQAGRRQRQPLKSGITPPGGIYILITFKRPKGTESWTRCWEGELRKTITQHDQRPPPTPIWPAGRSVSASTGQCNWAHRGQVPPSPRWEPGCVPPSLRLALPLCKVGVMLESWGT